MKKKIKQKKMEKKVENQDVEFRTYLPTDILETVCEFLPSRFLLKVMTLTSKDVKELVEYVLNERIKHREIDFNSVSLKYSYVLGKKAEYVNHEIISKENCSIILQYTFQKKLSIGILHLFSNTPDDFLYLLSYKVEEKMNCYSLKEMGLKTQFIVYNDKEVSIHCYEKKKVLHQLKFNAYRGIDFRFEKSTFSGELIISDYMNINSFGNKIVFNMRDIIIIMSYDGKDLTLKGTIKCKDSACLYELKDDFYVSIDLYFGRKILQLSTNKVVNNTKNLSSLVYWQASIYGEEEPNVEVTKTSFYKLSEKFNLLLDNLHTMAIDHQNKISMYTENAPKQVHFTSDKIYLITSTGVLFFENDELKFTKIDMEEEENEVEFINESTFISSSKSNMVIKDFFKQKILGECNISLSKITCLSDYKFLALGSKNTLDIYQFLPK